MTFDALTGASYVSPLAAWDMQRAINLYPEADESGAGKSPRALIGTPGLTLFATLPTSPVRGVWTGLIDSLPGTTDVDQCYAVAGAKLYRVASNGTYTQLGDVSDDASHSPVTFQVNGTQLLISSAGLLWVWDNVIVERAYFNIGYGTCNTDGLGEVIWHSGDPFDTTLEGGGIWIAGDIYPILAVTNETQLTLGGSSFPAAATNTAYRILGGAGTVDISGNSIRWDTGDRFGTLLAGDKILLGGLPAVVASVQDEQHLTVVATPAGDQFGATISFATAVPGAVTAFLDGYFLALPPNSKTFYLSAPNDGKKWSPLDFGRKSAFPDNIGGMLADHEELWLFGTETSEVWRNTGNADFPLERDPGAFIAQGIRAPFSAVSLANGVAWIGGDARGNPIAWRAQGYAPVRVSTHGVETAWASYSTVTDATAFVYVDRGHQFWVISFPTANATWVYDATAGMWHERGWWNGTTNDRARYSTHGYAFGKHLVGDWQTGKLYQLSEAAYTDDGTAIHRIRTAPHLSQEDVFTFYARFRLSIPAGLTPTLSWSDDAGATWHSEVAGSGRQIGGVTQLSMWRRLGKARDRVFRITITDAARVAIFAAYLDLGAGTV